MIYIPANQTTSMKIIQRLLIAACAFFLVFAFTMSALSQESIRSTCEESFKAIAKSIKISKVYRRDIYSADCDFEFMTGSGVNALVSIERFESEKGGKEGFHDDLDLYGGLSSYEQSIQKITADGNWNEARFFKSKSKTENFLLLRKNVTVVSVFSLDPVIPFTIEKLLRPIKF